MFLNTFPIPFFYIEACDFATVLLDFCYLIVRGDKLRRIRYTINTRCIYITIPINSCSLDRERNATSVRVASSVLFKTPYFLSSKIDLSVRFTYQCVAEKCLEYSPLSKCLEYSPLSEVSKEFVFYHVVLSSLQLTVITFASPRNSSCIWIDHKISWIHPCKGVVDMFVLLILSLLIDGRNLGSTSWFREASTRGYH